MKGGLFMFPFLVGTAAAAGDAADAAGVYIDNALSGVDFSVILNEIVAAAPIFLPSLIAIIGFKKALRWIVGSVKGA